MSFRHVYYGATSIPNLFYLQHNGTKIFHLVRNYTKTTVEEVRPPKGPRTMRTEIEISDSLCGIGSKYNFYYDMFSIVHTFNKDMLCGNCKRIYPKVYADRKA